MPTLNLKRIRSPRQINEKNLFWLLILMILLVGLTFFELYRYQQSEEMPPTIDFAEIPLQGLLKIEDKFLIYQNHQAKFAEYVAGKNFKESDKIDISPQASYYTTEKDLKIADIIQGISPDVDGIIIFYYSPGEIVNNFVIPKGFHVVPDSTFYQQYSNQNIHAVKEDNYDDFVIKKGRGFIIVAKKSGHAYGFKTAAQNLNFTPDAAPLASQDSGWVLVSIPDSKNKLFYDFIKNFERRIDNVWVQIYQNQFAKLIKANWKNYKSDTYNLVWLKLKKSNQN